MLKRLLLCDVKLYYDPYFKYKYHEEDEKLLFVRQKIFSLLIPLMMYD